MEITNAKPIPPKKRNQTAAQLANIEAHKFKRGQSGNPSGRPKNRVYGHYETLFSKKRMKELRRDLTDEEINTIERKLLQHTMAEIQVVAKSDDTPAYEKALAIAIMIDMKNGRTGTMDRLRDRQYGSIKQNINLNGEVKSTTWMDALIAAKQEEMEQEEE